MRWTGNPAGIRCRKAGDTCSQGAGRALVGCVSGVCCGVWYGKACAQAPVSPLMVFPAGTPDGAWTAPLLSFFRSFGVPPSLAADPAWVGGQMVAALAVMLALACAFWAARMTRVNRRLDGMWREEHDHLVERAERAERILAAEPGTVFVWSPEPSLSGPGQTSPVPTRMMGTLQMPGDAGTPLQAFEDFTGQLRKTDQRRLDEALRALHTRGTRFALTVETQDKKTFEAQGRPAGAETVLWLRDVTQKQVQTDRFRDRIVRAERLNVLLRAHLDALPAPAWLRDVGGRLLWVNQSYVAAVEAPSAESVLEKQIHLPGEEVDRPLRAKLDQAAVVHETGHVVVAGERVAADVCEFRLGPEEVGGILVDVSEREKARDELQRHVDGHRSTLDKLTSAVAIFGADKRLRFFNEAYERLWGLERAFFEGEPTEGEVLDALRTARKLPEQENFQRWKNIRLELYRATEPTEEIWHLPDGQTVRVLGEAHPLGGVLYVYENVTEKLRLESSYNVLESVQKATIDNLQEAVTVFGTDGRLKLHNPAFARIWDLGDEDLAHEPHINAIVHCCMRLHDDAGFWSELRNHITAAHDIRSEQSGRINREDGSAIDFAIVPLPDGATLTTFVDVTDSIRIERALWERNDALETADRLKSEFISHVSYQLRTPLTNIIGFGEILEKEMFGNLSAKQHEYSAGILESSSQLLEIVNDILDLATIEAGAMILSLSDVDITAVLRSVEEFALHPAQKNGVQLKLEYPPDPGVFRADEKRIKQILINLLSNALSFTSPGDTIMIGARRTQQCTELYVLDTGEGVAPEHQPAVFDRFEARSVADKRGGTGLGLSLVKSFVELHGGWVTFESRENIGTRVCCHFPVRHHEKGSAAETTVHEPDHGFDIQS